VSRAVNRLEAHHKARLLHRTTHGLSLTGEGETLQGHGKRLQTTLAELADDLAQNAGDVRGVLRVGVSPAMARYLIIPSLHGLYARHPHLQIDLQSDDRVVDMAREGIDLTIRTGTPQTDTVVARQIGIHQRALYAAPAYLQRHGTPQTPQDLAQHRLITNSVAHNLNRWPFKVQGEPLLWEAEGHYRADSTGMVLSMMIEGLGIGRANTAIAASLLRDGLLKPVLEQFVADEPVPIYAVMLQERHRSPKVRAAIEYWAEWFANLESPKAA
jgi:DNA-binding transcriptional LysR family regulator